MTEADVQELIRSSAARGRVLTESDARVVLGAKDVLKTEPNNPYAIEVCKNFDKFLKTGVHVASFAEFLLPIPRTDEARAEAQHQRNEFVEFYRKLSLVGIAEGDYNVAVAWRNQRSLTSQQILEMSDAEVVQRA